MATVSINKKREILDSAKGQMFHVTFVKADGSLRTMQAKKWVEKALASGDKNDKGVSNAPDTNYVLVDIEAYKVDPKRSYRSLKLENLVSCKVAGIEYTFDKQ
jgi:hypothetical protein